MQKNKESISLLQSHFLFYRVRLFPTESVSLLHESVPLNQSEFLYYTNSFIYLIVSFCTTEAVASWQCQFIWYRVRLFITESGSLLQINFFTAGLVYRLQFPFLCYRVICFITESVSLPRSQFISVQRHFLVKANRLLYYRDSLVHYTDQVLYCSVSFIMRATISVLRSQFRQY